MHHTNRQYSRPGFEEWLRESSLLNGPEAAGYALMDSRKLALDVAEGEKTIAYTVSFEPGEPPRTKSASRVVITAGRIYAGKDERLFNLRLSTLVEEFAISGESFHGYNEFGEFGGVKYECVEQARRICRSRSETDRAILVEVARRLYEGLRQSLIPI